MIKEVLVYYQVFVLQDGSIMSLVPCTKLQKVDEKRLITTSLQSMWHKRFFKKTKRWCVVAFF
jgi:hypothetical protein